MANIDREQKAFTGNKDHLSIILDALQKGESHIWNDWRFKNPELPDLIGINSSGASLVNFNFSASAFDNSNLTFTDLTSCDLSGANFYRADMRQVKMFHASAYGGQFRKTNLTDADFSRSVFNSADFKGATLTGSKIHGIGRTGWEIEEVECGYIYKQSIGGEGRFPCDRDFEPGEFEKTYKFYPLIELEFHEKIDALTILMVNYAAIQLNNEDSKFNFQIKEVSVYGNIPTVKVSVKSKEQISTGTELLKHRIEELQRQLADRKLDF
ncbi:MAG: pentapeptide repeat-containing protein [Desulfobulbaceae bacterium]|nr:pentapeptide repeat-containing protein [Desulfobulbaceae bacterium]